MSAAGRLFASNVASRVFVPFQPHPLNPPLLKKERGKRFFKRGEASLGLTFLDGSNKVG
jgi:hypothetical protein